LWPWRWRQYVSPKRLYPHTTPQCYNQEDQHWQMTRFVMAYTLACLKSLTASVCIPYHFKRGHFINILHLQNWIFHSEIKLLWHETEYSYKTIQPSPAKI
jgi:hypothetical protein